MNAPQIEGWADAVLSQRSDGMDNLLFDLHNMVMGNGGVFGSQAVIQVYRERVIHNTNSPTPCADLKAFIEYMTSLQAEGYVAWASAVNFKESMEQRELDGRVGVKAKKILHKGSNRLTSQARFLKKRGILPLPKLSIDAALRHTNGKTYFFRGDKYWRYNDKEDRIDAGYPKEISEGWDGMPGDIDAAFIWRKWPSDSWKTYFFKGDSYYAYTGNHGLSEKRSISRGWAGMSGNIGGVLNVRYAILGIKKARTTYFLKGNNLYRYYRFREKLAAAGSITRKWPGMNDPIDSVFRWSNGAVYFFKGEEYYRYDDKGKRTGGPWTIENWRGLC